MADDRLPFSNFGSEIIWLRKRIHFVNQFCESGLVVSPDTFSNALLPDASGVWLFDDDEARNF